MLRKKTIFRKFAALFFTAAALGVALPVGSRAEKLERTAELKPAPGAELVFVVRPGNREVFLPEVKRKVVAAVAESTGLVGRDRQGTSGDSTVQVALAPSADRKDDFLPEGKKETIAAVTVPEVAPQIRQAVLPRYPVFAREGKIQGTAQVRVLVDREGKVAAVGRVRGQSVFRQAVKEAVEKWEFYPAMQGTLAVKSWVTLPFSFEL